MRFAIICSVVMLGIACGDSSGPVEPDTGSIQVSLSTTGDAIDRDLDGYMLSTKNRLFALGTNPTTTISGLAEGSYQFTLEGLAPNCTVTSPNPVTIEVVRGHDVPIPVTFSVFCAPKVGTVVVSTVTSGDELDADGYTVNVTGPALTRVSIPVNGVRTISGIRAGPQFVSLGGSSENCVVEGPNPRSVDIPYNTTVEIVFPVQCVRSGAVELKITTSGVNADPDGYRTNLFRIGTPVRSMGAFVPHNGNVSFPGVYPGTYKLDLFDLVANCDTSVPAPPTIEVIAGATTTVLLDVVCTTPPELAVVSEHDGDREISVIRSDGTGRSRLTFNLGWDVDPAWGPDKSRIAFASNRSGNFDIYSIQPDGLSLVRLTFSGSPDRAPAWSPDGMHIAFSSERDGNSEIYVMKSDGTNPVRLTNNAAFDSEPVWSPDGKRILFSSDRDGGSLWIMNADGSAAIRLTTGAATESNAAWSPDGSRIAFSRALPQYGQALFIINADGSGEIEQLSAAYEEASNPSWSTDGRKLAFTSKYCDYYGFTCIPYIAIINANGTEHTTLIPAGTAQPAWRP